MAFFEKGLEFVNFQGAFGGMLGGLQVFDQGKLPVSPRLLQECLLVHLEADGIGKGPTPPPSLGVLGPAPAGKIFSVLAAALDLMANPVLV